jgi:hypothetical protein
MNLKLATLYFVASASAHNLRADKPRRFLQGGAPVSSSSSSENADINAFVYVRSDCGLDADFERDLERGTQGALDDYNSSSSKSRRRHLKSTSSEDIYVDLRSSDCNDSKSIEKQFEKAISKDISSSKSRRNRRLKDNDGDMTVYLVNGEELRARMADQNCPPFDDDEIEKLVKDLSHGNHRRLKGNVYIVHLDVGLIDCNGDVGIQLRDLIN